MLHLESVPRWLVAVMPWIVSAVAVLILGLWALRVVRRDRRSQRRAKRRIRHIAHQRAWSWVTSLRKPRAARLTYRPGKADRS